jgi:hypothetical protein
VTSADHVKLADPFSSLPCFSFLLLGFEFRLSGSWISLVSCIGVSTGVSSCWVSLFRRQCDFLSRPLESWVGFEMEKSFIVESKIFVFSVLDGASMLRVGEKRNSFYGEIIISSQCAEWLASTLEIPLGYPEDLDFIKSFRKGSKVLIARRGGYQASRFLEASDFRMGGRKGFLLILEGRGGWGWHKFSGELRKAVNYLSTKVGCGFGSSLASVKEDGKEEEVRLGLAPLWKGPSFVEILRSSSVSAVKRAPIVQGRQFGWRASPAEPCALDILPMVRHAEVEPRSAVDCFSLESLRIALLDFDRHLRPQGKKIISWSNMKFEFSTMRTWSKLGTGFNLALGRAVRKFLDWFVRSRLG